MAENMLQFVQAGNDAFNLDNIKVKQVRDREIKTLIKDVGVDDIIVWAGKELKRAFKRGDVNQFETVRHALELELFGVCRLILDNIKGELTGASPGDLAKLLTVVVQQAKTLHTEFGVQAQEALKNTSDEELEKLAGTDTTPDSKAC